MSKKVKSAKKKDIQVMANFCIKKLEDRNFFKHFREETYNVRKS